MEGNLFHRYPARQQGAVLFVSLLLMLVMTLLTVAAMQTTTLEESMAANLKDRNLAFQAAESALRDAEQALQGNIQPQVQTNPALDPDTPFWIWNWGSLATTPPLPWWRGSTFDAAWWNGTTSQSVATSTFNTINAAQLGLIQPPRFIVEYWMFDPDSHVMTSGYNRRETGRDIHRVTSRGNGGTQNATVLLQSAFVWRYDQR